MQELSIQENSVDVSKGCDHPFHIYLKDEENDFPLEFITGCHKRFTVLCPVCAKRWRDRNYNKFREAIETFKQPKFLTLTLKKDEDGNCDRVRKLWQYRKDLFKNLKRAGFKIERWIAVIELPNHIHMVYDGSYIAQSRIQRVWRRLTGDSWFVNIKAVRYGRSSAVIAHYLSKYMTKINDYEQNIFEELKGFHLVGNYNLGIKKKKLIFDYDKYRNLGLFGWKVILELNYWQKLLELSDSDNSKIT